MLFRSFYHYFANKHEFGEAVIQNYVDYYARKMTRIFDDPTRSHLQCLRAFVDDAKRGMLKYGFRRGCLIGNMGQELGGLDDVFRKRILGVLNSWTGFLAACLREGQDAGEIRADLNVQQIASFFWFSWEGAILKAKLERSTRPLDQFSAVTFQSILKS